MSYKLDNISTPKVKIRNYSNLAGVDLAHLPSKCMNCRSPDAMNIYKDYTSTSGQAIETRLGYKMKKKFDGKIYAVHVIDEYILVHHGTNLSVFKDELDNVVCNFDAMNERVSVSFIFSSMLYLIDGVNYIFFDTCEVEKGVQNVVGFIPTTRINADPSGKNAEVYQDVNMLSEYRVNTFIGDGVANTFYLDSSFDKDSVPIVKVNGEQVLVDSYSSEEGIVTLREVPNEPMSIARSNVSICFKCKNDSSKVLNSTIALVFDGRVFLSGNSKCRGEIIHSELENPAYFSDNAYYNDGDDNASIQSMVGASNTLIVIKEDRADGSKVYFHTPSIDYELGKVYPTMRTNIMLGAISAGINFDGEICYMTKLGLKSLVNTNASYRLWHKSSMVDRDLSNEAKINDIKVWRGYLLLLSDDRIYLADSRQKHNDFGSWEYEWYIWDSIELNGEKAMSLFVIDDELFFFTEHYIVKFEGSNDNGDAINSYWTTPEDTFEYPAYLKTTQKRGASAWVKNIANSMIKVDINTDRDSNDRIFSQSTSGFNYENGFSYLNRFCYLTSIRSQIFFKAKKKKIKFFSLKFYSDEIDKPFGLYDIVVEYRIVKYAKR